MRYSMVLILAVFLVLAGLIRAGEKADWGQLETFLAEKIIADYHLDPANVTITMARCDLPSVAMDGCDIQVLPLTRNEPRGRFPMQVKLYRDGALLAQGAVSLEVRYYTDLLVPVRQIDRREILTPDLFAPKRFDVTSITEGLVAEAGELQGCRAKQNLTAGRYVPKHYLEKIPDVEYGSPITIVAKTGGLEIRARGVAMQNGSVGEAIKVMNGASKKILLGTVTALGIVEVAI